MTIALRAARWCAVSTKEQHRPDKFSLENQLEDTQLAISSRGWRETAGPYVVKQSREQYIQLYQAEKEIPDMQKMLHAARAKQFDVLVMTETDRMRGLLEQVFRTLAQFGIQLFFTNIPIEPMPPARYSIYNADQVLMVIKMAQTASSLEISRTRRKYLENMPKRITDLGLPAGNISFGYRKPKGEQFNRKAIPEPNPLITPHIIAIKNLLLAGHSTSELIDYLEDHQVPPPKGGRWHPQAVRDILRNPFYAGVVQFGKSRTYIDPITEKRKRNRHIPQEEIKQNTGRHQPLWDLQTYKDILHELKRRGKHYRGRVNNQFTGLVKCGICGASMWRQSNGPRAHRLIWRCSSTASASGHCNFLHDVLIEKVAQQLEVAVNQTGMSETTQEEIKPTFDSKKVEELNAQLARLEDAYLAGEWDLNRYTERKKKIESELADQQGEIKDQLRRLDDHHAWLNTLETMADIKDLGYWLRTKDPSEVNRTLHVLLKEITVYPDAVQLVARF